MIKKINKIQSKVRVDYLFISGYLDINTEYFIKQIEKGIKENNNENFKSNIAGFMTSYKYFLQNINFLKIIYPLFDYIDSLENIKKYNLDSAWGIKQDFSNYAKEHDHNPNYLSGIIYLNNHNQTISFPELSKKYTPSINSFFIFSSFLKHKTIRNTFDESKYALSFNLGYN
tara:strand:- start:224 stop:739 length:516 start_codon:yes stop_codon:yes gene_type:complete